jgi:hypothetical protein
MSRSVFLVLVVAVAALIFSPVAVAQDDNPSADDRGMDDRGFDDDPDADDVMGSPAASASATSSAASTATATASATATAAATSGAGEEDMTSSVGKTLPRTGGASLVSLVSGAALILLVGSGTLATRLVRRGR